MNPDSPTPPPADPEARLTALLLGELSPDDATEVRRAIERDPNLAQLHARLSRTVELVRAAAKAPGGEASLSPGQPRFSPERREALLAAFKTVKPAAFSPASAAVRRRRTRWLALAAGLVAMLVIVGGMLLPALSKAKSKGRAQLSMPEVVELQRLAEARRTLERRTLETAKGRVPEDAGAPHFATAGRARGAGLPGASQPESGAPQAQPTSAPAGAPAVLGFEPARPETREVRLMMRYGLVPKGLKGVADTSAPATPASTQDGAEAAKPSSEGLWGFFTTMNRPLAGGDATPGSVDVAGERAAGDRLEVGKETSPAAPEAGRSIPDNFVLHMQHESVQASQAGALGVTEEKAKGEKVTNLGDEPVLGQLFRSPAAREPATEAEIARVPLTPAARPLDSNADASRRKSALAELESLGEQEGGVAGQQIRQQGKLSELRGGVALFDGAARTEDSPAIGRPPPPLEPPPEVATAVNPFSTFSLNVTDVSFKLAAASLEQNQVPDAASIRVEEFINAFDYRDPEPTAGAPIAFAWERARYPFAHNRELLRFAVQTAARGREPGRPLNLVLVLDSSGSMERADRVAIIREALRVLAGQLQPQDKISVVAFARTARLWVDGLAGSQAGELVERVGNLTPEGGTNLEAALQLGYETARRHFLVGGANRVILLTDGAANLGDVEPASLQRLVETQRARGVALDCFGIGWEGFNDDLLETLSRHGDGRYGFVNSPEEAASGFAEQLAGALQVAAADVKVQVEFNPRRVTTWRQIGYAKHQLTKEQFRDNAVDAAELGAAESGNALYVVEVNPQGEGPLGVVRIRYRVPATGAYRELEWALEFKAAAGPLEGASPAMRLAASAAAFGELLSGSPFASEVTSEALLKLLRGVPEAFDPDSRPKTLEWMVRQFKAVAGK